jgi:hypothetical protein
LAQTGLPLKDTPPDLIDAVMREMTSGTMTGKSRAPGISFLAAEEMRNDPTGPEPIGSAKSAACDRPLN